MDEEELLEGLGWKEKQKGRRLKGSLGLTGQEASSSKPRTCSGLGEHNWG